MSFNIYDKVKLADNKRDSLFYVIGVNDLNHTVDLEGEKSSEMLTSIPMDHVEMVESRSSGK